MDDLQNVSTPLVQMNVPSKPVPGVIAIHDSDSDKVQRTSAINFQRLKTQYPLFHASEVGDVLRRTTWGAGHLIAGLLPRASVNLLVGDSGIGKSALMYQLALAVASGATIKSDGAEVPGVPFLGFPTRRCKVLLVDYENSLADAHRILNQQRRFLQLAQYPSDFLLWCMQLDPSPIALSGEAESVIHDLGAELVILDSLRSFSPAMENDGVAAVAQIKRMREIASRLGTTFLMIHHLRKQNTDGLENLEEGPALDWLIRASGVRALINQTDVRLAIARRMETKGGKARSSDKESSESLVLRGHVRTRGEIGPYLLRRVWDDDGEPAGYERVTPTVEMIENPDQQAAFVDLAEQFTFKEARLRLNRSNDITNAFVHKLMQLGLARKVGRGLYAKGGYAPEKAA